MDIRESEVQDNHDFICPELQHAKSRPSDARNVKQKDRRNENEKSDAVQNARHFKDTFPVEYGA